MLGVRLSQVVSLGAVALLSAGALVGCNDDLEAQNEGRIQVRPASVQFAQVDIGQTATEEVTVENVGQNTLEIHSLEFRSEEGSSIDGLTLTRRPEDESTIEPDQTKTIEVEYAPQQEGTSSAGVIEILSSDPNFSEDNPLEIPVRTLGNSPRMRVSPEPIRFPPLTPGQRMERTVEITNRGSAPLKVYEKPIVQGSDDYDVRGVSDIDWPVTIYSASSAGDSERESLEVPVEYHPSEDGNAEASLLIRSNNELGSTPDSPSERSVDIRANAETPCLLLDGTTRNIGAVPVGSTTVETITVENCGTEPLAIEGLGISQNTADDEFALALGERDADGDGELDEEIRLPERGDRASFAVEYSPVQEGSDRATLVIRNNDPVQPEAEVELIGRGAEGECPVANLTGKIEGESSRPVEGTMTADPLDYIILDGSESQDPDGRVVDWSWEVLEKPEDAQVEFRPLEGSPDDKSKRKIRLLTAGDYRIGLTAKDNDGFVSCERAELVITATPNEKVHVELTWTNPKDPDETDDTGSDVDVHMVKMGPGEWFQSPFDVYFRNPEANWQPENPSLDIDDTDGAGPENIQMNNPQDCQWYAVGVHYYEQRFGTAYATIRVYIRGELVFEQLHKPLKTGGQFWDVARIHWPTGRVFVVDELRSAEPSGKEPRVTDAMKRSELCTAEDLYNTQ